MLENIKRILAPRQVKNSIFELTGNFFKENHIKGILLDCDNTLMPWHEHVPGDAAKQWVGALKAAGYPLCIVSNNMFRHKRITSVAAQFGLPCVSEAMKPFPFGLRRALALTKTQPAETVMIGDQLLTDIVGGNILGLYTVLVQPMSAAEFPTTKYLNRNVEKMIIGFLKRTGAWNLAGSGPNKQGAGCSVQGAENEK